MKLTPNYLLFFLILAVFACQQAPQADTPIYEIHKSVVADSAMVVAAHPLATQVGLDVLKKGGNAIDAAVAVQFALAVVNPRAGNIGGGGFMVYRGNDGSVDAIDYREKAPAGAHRDMYLDSIGDIIPNLSRVGHLANGVPGSVSGLTKAHSKHGRLPFADVINPAIELAADGFKITRIEAARLNRLQEAFNKVNTQPSVFVKDTFLIGELLVQKDLAETLTRIRDNGRDGFYKGKTAQLIVEEMQRGGGLISLEDLANYEAQWRTPLTSDYKNYKIISMPPASSGGVALIQMLEMIEPYPISEWGMHDPRSMHLMVEAMRRAYADRAEHLGDSDFYDVPLESLMDNAYLMEQMESFSVDSAGSSESILAGNFELRKESFETTHTSVVDAEGNAVSVTTTINSGYGNKLVVGGAGFFMNNEMDDFSSKPGVPNQFGLVGAEANSIQPGKRMLSSMTPTILEKDGDLFMVVGAPGGSTIITAVFQVIVNVIEFDQNLAEAVSAVRIHHQWLPDEIKVEGGEFDSLVTANLAAKNIGRKRIDGIALKQMENMGHKIDMVTRMALVKAVHVMEDGKLHGMGDPRNPDDDAKGY
ncbi:MAG: gamma-glutamyltransferase [Bacteroidota bacterium]